MWIILKTTVQQNVTRVCACTFQICAGSWPKRGLTALINPVALRGTILVCIGKRGKDFGGRG